MTIVHNNLGSDDHLRSSDGKKPVKIMNVENFPECSPYKKELNQKINPMNLLI